MKTLLKFALCLSPFFSTLSLAEVVTDGSLGTADRFTGKITIPQQLGKTVGDNLYHSFSTFNIDSDESVTFSGAASLKNVISRVTGGQVSSINGLLKSEIGQANFYFINPAGITFGSHAQVNVPAAFHVSTASQLKFSDGTAFALNTPASALTIAAPTEFGFLAPQAGDINIASERYYVEPTYDANWNEIPGYYTGDYLHFEQAQPVSFSADNIVINHGSLTNPSGNITLQALNQLSITNSSVIDNSTDTARNAGNLNLIAPQITIENSKFLSNANLGSTGNAGQISIQATQLTVDAVGILGNALITNRTYSTGNSGALTINSDEVLLKNEAILSNSTYGIGNGATLTINAKELIADNGFITNNTSSFGLGGNAGNIAINSEKVSITNGGYISSRSNGAGNAGNINLHSQSLEIDSKGTGDSTGIFTSGAIGKGGDITIASEKTLLKGAISTSATVGGGNAGNIFLQGKELLIDSGIIASETASEANAGNITLKTDKVTVNNGSINTSTYSNGHAGDITLTDAKELTLTNNGIIKSETALGIGNAGNIHLSSEKIGIANAGKILSTTDGGQGKAGDITLQANNVNIYGKVIDSYGGIFPSQISSAATNTSTGQAGTINITANQTLHLYDGGKISVQNDGIAKKPTLVTAGNIQLNAATIQLDDNALITAASSGNVHAGAINITSPNALTLNNLAKITSATSGSGKAGNLTINTGQLVLASQSGLETLAHPNSTGQAGIISINSDNLILHNGSTIRSDTYSSGKAGDIIIDNSGKIEINRQNSRADTGISTDTYTGLNSTGDAGNITITTGQLDLLNAGEISSNTDTAGKAGNISVTAQEIVMDGQGSSRSTSISTDATKLSTGNAGTVEVNSTNLTMRNGSSISSSTRSQAQGTAGTVNVNADRILIDGQNNSLYTGMFSDSYANFTPSGTNLNQGSAAKVNITANQLSLINNGQISSSTWSAGNAGDVTLNAATIALDNASIQANAKVGSSGKGGEVTVTATESLTAKNSASISSATFSSGKAGNVMLNTPVLNLDSEAKIQATANQGSSGQAGMVTVKATKQLQASNRASINSSTFGSGKAGDVTVQTPNLLLDSGAEISALAGKASAGETGVINLTAQTVQLNNGGKITVQNDGVAANPALIKAANLALTIPKLTLQGGLITAATSGNVNAGDVLITTEQPLVMNAGASINSNTTGSGSAGNVSVTTPVLRMDNASISAEAFAQSQGQTGNVIVNAGQAIYLTGQSKLSMQNDAMLANPEAIIPTAVSVAAPVIALKDSAITTAANGNVDAGNINLHFDNLLSMDNSLITTTAYLGDGGTISAGNGTLINLQNSGFLTSVTGAIGNGGNINVNANTLVMNTGVIQANAVGGSGGNINLKLQNLIPSQNSLILGGSQVVWQPFIKGFNVIQAASASGVNGTVNVTSPQFNISGSISGLDSAKLVLPITESTTCQGSANSSSHLVRNGKGGVPLNEVKTAFIPLAMALPSSNQATSTDSRPSQLVTSKIVSESENNGGCSKL